MGAGDKCITAESIMKEITRLLGWALWMFHARYDLSFEVTLLASWGMVCRNLVFAF